MPKTLFARLCNAAVFWLAQTQPMGSMPDPATLCDQAAHRAARLNGVPLDILLAVTRAETGRGDGGAIRPWPWTINIAGQGSWFETAQEAQDNAAFALASGQDNFDVGCFQLNYRWHGQAFASVEAMFDPEANADYAARYLAQHFASSGSWAQAVADYHSKTDTLAEVYLSKVEALLGGVLSPDYAQTSAQQMPTDAGILNENLFPLLQSGESGAQGSLVPRTNSRGSLFAVRS